MTRGRLFLNHAFNVMTASEQPHDSGNATRNRRRETIFLKLFIVSAAVVVMWTLTGCQTDVKNSCPRSSVVVFRILDLDATLQLTSGFFGNQPQRHYEVRGVCLTSGTTFGIPVANNEGWFLGTLSPGKYAVNSIENSKGNGNTYSGLVTKKKMVRLLFDVGESGNIYYLGDIQLSNRLQVMNNVEACKTFMASQSGMNQFQRAETGFTVNNTHTIKIEEE